ncbi:MAG: serine/threonine protein kinase [Deltaproteobacteria bacterium]|nr:serine/threonine protein kinase [Deltaproteobacteria bacterium]
MKSCPSCHRAYVDEEQVCALDDSPLETAAGALPRDVGRSLGRYRLIALLGEGGMGRVFAARHVQLKRLVAVKWLRRELAEHRAHMGRFFDEARAIDRTCHPNIVDVVDLVEDVLDGAYYIMELLRGHDLRREIAAGPAPPRRAVAIAAQVAEALAAVHAIGIVHRDLKPENVLLIERGGRDDFVKIVDFGVAQVAEEGTGGRPVGTAAYMSPEQGAGGPLDGRSDLYALGVMLFEMVTGRHPFPSQSEAEYLLRHADEPPPSPRACLPLGTVLPPALEQVMLRCLAKRPEERFPDGTALAAALRAVDLDAPPAPPPRRSRWRIATVFGLVVGVLVGLALVALARHGSPRFAPARPGAAPAPARPDTVTLTLRSEPSGAEVFRAGETVPLCTTPGTAPLPRGAGTARLRFRLAGHEEAEVLAPLGATGEVSARLRPLAPPDAGTAPAVERRPARPAPAGAQKVKKAVNRDGVLDPFAQ